MPIMYIRYTVLQNQTADGGVTYQIYDKFRQIAVGHPPMTDKVVAHATCDALNYV